MTTGTIQRIGKPPLSAGGDVSSTVRESLDSSFETHGVPVLFASSLYEAAKKFRGDSSPRKFLLIVGTEVIPSEGVVLTGNQTIAANTTWGSYDPDVLLFVRVEGTLTINAGVYVSSSHRKLGMVVYSQGNLTVSGRLHMDNRAGYRADPTVALQVCGGITLPTTGGGVAGTGVAGITNTTTTAGANGNAGSAATGRKGGGGAGGGRGASSGYSVSIGGGGDGSVGRTWGGGAGGGGSGYGHNGASATAPAATTPYHAPPGRIGSVLGEGGMAGYNYHDGPSAGTYVTNDSSELFLHPGLVTATSGTKAGRGGGTDGFRDGQNGGGLLIVMCEGNVLVNVGGFISADTGKDLMTYTGVGYAAPGGGGAAGGGIVLVLRTGTYTNSGTVRANGSADAMYGTAYIGGITSGNPRGGNSGVGWVESGVLAA